MIGKFFTATALFLLIAVALGQNIIPGTANTAAPSGDPIAVTLNESNTGPRYASETTHGVLRITAPGTYERFTADQVLIASTASPVILRDCTISGSYSYSLDTTDSWTHIFNGPNDITIEYCYISQADNGKAVLGGGFTMYRSHVDGGEDGLHLAGGQTVVRESIIEEIHYIGADPHSDSIQLTSGGSGGSLTVEDSILQCGYNMSNAPLQVNVINGPVVSNRNWYHGGVYHIHGDEQTWPVTSTDDMFAYLTSNTDYITSVASLVRPVWWSRQVRPRVGTPYATPAGEAAGFPGNGTPAAQ